MATSIVVMANFVCLGSLKVVFRLPLSYCLTGFSATHGNKPHALRGIVKRAEHAFERCAVFRFQGVADDFERAQPAFIVNQTCGREQRHAAAQRFQIGKTALSEQILPAAFGERGNFHFNRVAQAFHNRFAVGVAYHHIMRE